MYILPWCGSTPGWTRPQVPTIINHDYQLLLLWAGLANFITAKDFGASEYGYACADVPSARD
jgi:hypothetical protein